MAARLDDQGESVSRETGGMTMLLGGAGSLTGASTSRSRRARPTQAPRAGGGQWRPQDVPARLGQGSREPTRRHHRMGPSVCEHRRTGVRDRATTPRRSSAIGRREQHRTSPTAASCRPMAERDCLAVTRLDGRLVRCHRGPFSTHPWLQRRLPTRHERPLLVKREPRIRNAHPSSRSSAPARPTPRSAVCRTAWCRRISRETPLNGCPRTPLAPYWRALGPACWTARLIIA
jgi:hypothetical protein